MDKLAEIFTLERLVHSLIIVFIAFIIYQVIKVPINRLKTKGKKTRGGTYFSIINNVVSTCYFAIVLLLILQVYGIDITTMLAGFGLVSAVVALALQDTLKDIIRGITMVSEDYFRIGDYVTIGNKSGTVVKLGMRATQIRDGLTGNVITIANSEINTVEVCAHLLNIDIPLPYDLKLSKAEAIMAEIVEKVSTFDNVAECEYRGVSELAESSINYRIYIKTTDDRIQVKRDTLRAALAVLEAHNINVPYRQIDVHQKS